MCVCMNALYECVCMHERESVCVCERGVHACMQVCVRELLSSYALGLTTPGL